MRNDCAYSSSIRNDVENVTSYLMLAIKDCGIRPGIVSELSLTKCVDMCNYLIT